jgi:DNA polymerase elongation subunit (family B)
MTEYNEFINGIDRTQGIVSIEANDKELEIFTNDGSYQFRPNSMWLLSPEQHTSSWLPLNGNNHYKYLREYNSWRDWSRDAFELTDTYKVWNKTEAAMLRYGLTYYKGMQLSEVSLLAFDIESTGIQHNKDSKVLLISNTYRQGSQIIKKLFKYSDYTNEAEMFEQWSTWVRELNPSIITGHNIFMYDLPYMQYCANKCGATLRLGRDHSEIRFDKRESKYRRDGSQDYYYTNAHIYGREIVDTFFLSIKYDFARKYESYGLKYIVKAEGLEKPNRQHYDASLIAKNYRDADEWAKICAYAEDDADDAVALFDRMIPSFFYLCQSVPKTLQQIINGASGSWLNAFLLRSYLSIGHSIPKAQELVDFEGAISLGNVGVYKNCFKVDVSSLYPSIMLKENIHDSTRDPNNHFIKMVRFFTEERLRNKQLAKETSEQRYKDMEQSVKVFINSAYGLLGTPGLNFNYPSGAAAVTSEGRRLLTQAMDWAQPHYKLVNADTDSIMISSDKEWNTHHKDEVRLALNELSGTGIKWDDDGTYDAVVVVKAKNYYMVQGERTKVKGSALKAGTREKALNEFITKFLNSLVQGNDLLKLYDKYVREICSLSDINRWVTRKSVTEKLLNPQRTNEAKIASSLTGSEQMGDKIYTFFSLNDNIFQASQWNGYNHSETRLLEKLYKTVQIFDELVDVKQFPNYKLKRNQPALLAIKAGLKLTNNINDLQTPPQMLDNPAQIA